MHRRALVSALLSVVILGSLAAPASAAEVSSLTLTLGRSAWRVGEQACATALVEGRKEIWSGVEPLAGIVLNWVVTGANPTTAETTTDANGEAQLCRTGTAHGSDTVRVFIDADGDGTYDTDERTAADDMSWLPAIPRGRLQSWGSNNYGQQGNTMRDGSAADRPWPQPLFTAAAGGRHTLVQTTIGTVWGAGSTEHGQTGTNVQGTGCQGYYPCNTRSEPQNGGLVNQRATDVAAGDHHSLAITQAGDVYAWGSNHAGQLGLPANTPNMTSCLQGGPGKPITYDPCTYTPTRIPGLEEVRVVGSTPQPPATYIVDVVAGGDFTLALKAETTPGTDSVWGWGAMNHKIVGANAFSSPTPARLEGLTGAGIIRLAAGDDHALALRRDGAVLSWGYGDGVGNGTSRTSAARVQGLPGPAYQIAAGNDHSLALMQDGTVWAWGLDMFGQVGDGVDDVRNANPVPVLTGPGAPLTGVVAIAAGGDHSLALKADGTVWAWGLNDHGQLYEGTSRSCTAGGNQGYVPCSRYAIHVSGVAGAFSIDAGDHHSIALVRDTVAPVTTATVSPTPSEYGWNATDPTVALSTTDAGGSGFASLTYEVVGAQTVARTTVTSPTASISITAEGTSRVRFFATDGDGNAESQRVVVVNLDRGLPTISGALDTPANAAGWRNQRTHVHWTCDDALSGVVSCPEPVLFGEGRDHGVGGTARDAALNEATAYVVDFHIDLTPPTLSFSRSPDANAAGWSNRPVEVTANCDDALSGVAECPAPQTFGEGRLQIAGGRARDVADNDTSAVLRNINVDLTPPSMRLSRSPEANGAGWANTPVTVSATCTDLLSGVASCPAAQTFGEGGGQVASATAVDVADNATTEELRPINVDLTPPTLLLARSPEANAHGWSNTPVEVAATCADELSGVASCPALQVFGEGQGQSATGAAHDRAENATKRSVSGIDVDLTAPTIGYSGAAASYTIDQDVSIRCSASDALAGIDTTTCAPITGPAWSFPLGANTFRARATDRAGNSAGASVSFVVEVTFTSLQNLTSRFVDDPREARAMNAQLEAARDAANRGNDRAKDGALKGYVRHVRSASGRTLTAAEADILIRSADAL